MAMAPSPTKTPLFVLIGGEYCSNALKDQRLQSEGARMHTAHEGAEPSISMKR